MPSFDPPPIPEPFPPALVQFVFAPDPFQKSDYPRDLMAGEIEAFVYARVNPTIDPAAFEQLFLVLDHYDLFEVAPFLLAMIEPKAEAAPAGGGRPATKGPLPLALAMRLTIIKTAVVTGLPPERTRAAALFRAASTEAPTQELSLWQQAIETYEAGVLDLDAAPLAERLGSTARSLARFETSLDPADAEKRRQFGEYDALNRRLVRATKVANSKRAILALADRRSRIRVLIRAYLDLPGDYPGYLIDWAARRLRREAWALQPAEQIERQYNLELRHELVVAFRATLAEIGAGAASDDVKDKRRVAVLDAIQFFSGTLSEKEGEFLVTAGEGYVLPLSVRQIWPRP